MTLDESDLVERTLRHLLKCQLNNGAWTFLHPGAVEGLLLFMSSPLSTAQCIEGISQGVRMVKDKNLMKEAVDAVARGCEYLIVNQSRQGSWYASDVNGFITTLAVCLEALDAASKLGAGTIS